MRCPTSVHSSTPRLTICNQRTFAFEVFALALAFAVALHVAVLSLAFTLAVAFLALLSLLGLRLPRVERLGRNLVKQHW